MPLNDRSSWTEPWTSCRPRPGFDGIRVAAEASYKYIKGAASGGAYVPVGCVKDLGQFLGLLIRQRLLLGGGR